MGAAETSSSSSPQTDEEVKKEPHQEELFPEIVVDNNERPDERGDLTENAIVQMVIAGSVEGIDPDDSYLFQPKLQIMDIKPIGYRVTLFDGNHCVDGRLATTQLNCKVQSNEIQKNSIVQITQFKNLRIQERNVINIKDLVVVSSSTSSSSTSRIGTNPLDIERALPQLREGGGDVEKALPQQEGGGESRTTLVVSEQSPRSNNTNQVTVQEVDEPNNSTSNNNLDIEQLTATLADMCTNTSSFSRSTTPLAETSAIPNITSISSLNMRMFNNNRWTIRARIISKSDIRTWSNAKGEGSLFSIDLLDSSGMDIRGIFFYQAVTVFYPILEVGNIYQITGGRLKIANRQYNSCKSNYEISFDRNAQFYLDQEDNDDGQIPQPIYNFMKINMLDQILPNEHVNIIAVVKHVGDVIPMISKKLGQEMVKCDLTLVDDSCMEITLTVWRNQAIQASMELIGQPIIAIQRARVSDYGGGRSLSISSPYEINPMIPERHVLGQWWNTIGSQTVFASLSRTIWRGISGRIPTLSERQNIAAISNENMGLNSDQADYVSFGVVTVTMLAKGEGDAWYPACPNPDKPCNNRCKVIRTTDNQWICDKCQGTLDHCIRQWIFSGVVEDESGSTWVTFFNEHAEVLFNGIQANDVYTSTHSEGAFDRDAYNSVFAPVMYSEWVMKVQVKKDLYKDEPYVKKSVVNLWPVDYVSECRDMLKFIETFNE